MTSIEKNLKIRSNSVCEFCRSSQDLHVYHVIPKTAQAPENCVLCCGICLNLINNPIVLDSNHWRCLADSMWNENKAVQVATWQMLSRLKSESWAQDLLDNMYLDEETQKWAVESAEFDYEEEKPIHKDANGFILKDGDSIVLIKDLEVKGANFTAKRGAAVHNISLVWDNENQIEGRLEGQYIVILTQYVKKTK